MTATPPLHLKVSSRLMQDARAASPLRHGTFWCAAQGPDGELEQFFVAPVSGHSERIHHVRREAKSPSGFRLHYLDHAFRPQGLTAAADGGRMVVFAIGEDRSRPEIHWAERRGVDPWSALRRLTVPNQPSLGRVHRLTATVLDGSLRLFAVIQERHQQVLFHLPWQGAGEWLRLGPVGDLEVLPMSLAGGAHGVVAAVPSSAGPTRWDLRFFQANGTMRNLHRGLQIDLWATARRADGVSSLFFYDAEGGDEPRLMAIDGGNPSRPPQEIQRGSTLRRLIATDAGVEPLLLFVLDGRARLSVLRADAEVPFQFHGPLPIASQVGTVVAGHGGRRRAELMVADGAGNPRVLWHQGRGETSSWLEHAASLPAESLDRFDTYTTELTVLDDKGSLQAAQEVELGASRQIKIHHAGASHWIGPDAWLRLRTSFDGRLTIVLPTGGLDAPQLRVRRPGSAEGDLGPSTVAEVDPTYAVHNQMKAWSVEQVREVLPSHRRGQAAAVHRAVQSALSLHPSGSALVQSWWLRGSAQGLAPPSGGGWIFEADAEGCQFRTLGPGEAERLMAAAMDPSAAGQIQPWQWLGDLLQAAANGFAQAIKVIVDPIRGGIQALVELVVDGVRWVFRGILKLAEHAFRLAQTIFHAVEVGFERLFFALAWRLEQAREDIWRTHQVFDRLLDGSIAHLVDFARQGERLAHDFFAARERELNDSFEHIIQALGDQRFAHSQLADWLPQDPTTSGLLRSLEGMAEHQAATNWIFEKVSTPASGLSVEPSLTEPMLGPIRDLMKDLLGLIDEEFHDHVDRLTAYFRDIATHPEAFAQRTVAEVLREIRSIMLFCLRLLDDIAKAFFRVLGGAMVVFRDQVLRLPVGGFLLQAVYDLLNPNAEEAPQTLTVGRLLSLIVAFPTAIIYRLLYGEGPFSVDDVEALKAELGRAEVMDGSALPRPVLAHRAQGFLIASGIARIFPWSLMDTYLDMVSAMTRKPPGSAEGDDGVVPQGVLGALNAVIGCTPLLLSVLAWPGGPFTPLVWSPELRRRRNVAWLSGFGPPCVATLMALLTGFKVSPRGSGGTNLVLTLAGAAGFALGAQRLDGERMSGKVTVGRVFIALAGPLPGSVRPLGLIEGPYKPVALGALAAVDLVCHWLAGIGLIAEASEPPALALPSAAPRLAVCP